MAITINLSGFGDGTYTIEDDGTPGNGTSVVRDPFGVIIQTIIHPTDSLTIISRAGQSIVFNVIDSLTTAAVTVGSLTVPGERPDSIQIGAVLTSNTVILAANNAISEFGSDASSDIVAGKLFMDAGTGIGVFNPIETQVSVLEAESQAGDINLFNVNNLTIGGAAGTSDLRGLFTGSSGNVRLINQGTITLNDLDGVETVRSAGNLTLNAIGATADINVTSNQDAMLAIGNIFLSAGRDILIGRIGTNFDNDVRAGGSITISAGRDFAIDGFSDMAADDQGLQTNGGITITAGRDILIDDAFGSDSSVSISNLNGTGSIQFTTGVGGTFLLHANSSSAVFGRSGGVTVRADRMLIESDSGISTFSGGVVTLTTVSPGRGINLGSVSDNVTELELSDAELDRIFAQNLVIGSVDAGTISVVGPLTSPNNNLTLQTGSDLIINAGITTPASLALVAGESIVQTGGTISTGALTANTDSPDLDPAGGFTFFQGTLTVTSNIIRGNGDNDVLIGSSSGDAIFGFAGNDILNGLAGNDNMFGGTGNDSYTVDSGGDAVTELLGEGTDTINTTVSYVLASGVSVESLLADAGAVTPLSLVGNAFNQVIAGNAGDNSINGFGGADTLVGRGGNDTYTVSDSNTEVFEAVGEGNDIVFTSVNWVMRDGQEIELLLADDAAATTPLSLAGNAFAQLIAGNAGDNTLNGRGGADTLIGRVGNDTYFVDDAAAQVIESAGEGNDTVFTTVSFALGGGQEIEALFVNDASSVTAINLLGNAFGQLLAGNEGSNILNGGAGNDSLVGRGGADNFAFTTALGASNVDTIFDFQVGIDEILLDDAIFTGLPPGPLAAGAFRLGSTAVDADDRILYDAATGALRFDADGVGGAAAVQFASLQPGLGMSASDFTVL